MPIRFAVLHGYGVAMVRYLVHGKIVGISWEQPRRQSLSRATDSILTVEGPEYSVALAI